MLWVTLHFALIISVRLPLSASPEPIIDFRFQSEVLRRQIWQVADFSGVEVIAYCVMGNHFHVLVRVPDKDRIVVSDEELMRRYRVLYRSRRNISRRGGDREGPEAIPMEPCWARERMCSMSAAK